MMPAMMLIFMNNALASNITPSMIISAANNADVSI